MTSTELIKSAQNLIRSLCHDKDGWEFREMESLKDDPWGADTLLIFNREDYVVCYVGVRNESPLYVLQRIE